MIELVGAAASSDRLARQNAVDLCLLVFRQGKAVERYAMPTDDLLQLAGLTVPALESAISLAIEHDWAWRARSYLGLKATGIHMVKVSLGLY